MPSFGGYHPYGLASKLTGLESNRACVGYAWTTNCSPSTPSHLFTGTSEIINPKHKFENLIHRKKELKTVLHPKTHMNCWLNGEKRNLYDKEKKWKRFRKKKNLKKDFSLGTKVLHSRLLVQCRAKLRKKKPVSQGRETEVFQKREFEWHKYRNRIHYAYTNTEKEEISMGNEPVQRWAKQSGIRLVRRGKDVEEISKKGI
ncbi:nibrin [Trichonephila clavipes]|nr:nibrin [Trichonephila clavipes]